MRNKITADISADCTKKFVAVRDTMELLQGKWKIFIVSVLMHKGKMRFMDLTREVEGIAAKMLSKELHDLEMNGLVKRTVCNTKPVTVEYEITEYGRSLEKIVTEIMDWGPAHRKRVFSKPVDEYESVAV